MEGEGRVNLLKRWQYPLPEQDPFTTADEWLAGEIHDLTTDVRLLAREVLRLRKELDAWIRNEDE